VVNTGVIGPFSGHEPAESDTEDGGDDARDGSEKGFHENDDDDRDREPREDRTPTKPWERSSFDGSKSR